MTTDSGPVEKLRVLLQTMVCELVDQPAAVVVVATPSDGRTVILTVRTASGELGKVIGKQGRNARALRVLLEATAAKYKHRAVLEIEDEQQGGYGCQGL